MLEEAHHYKRAGARTRERKEQESYQKKRKNSIIESFRSTEAKTISVPRYFGSAGAFCVRTKYQAAGRRR